MGISDAALFFEELNHFGASAGGNEIISETACLDHAFNLEVVLDGEGHFPLLPATEDLLNVDVSESVEELHAGLEAASGEGGQQRCLWSFDESLNR